MEYTQLGRTGLRVSRAALGTGGPSTARLASRSTEVDSIRLIQSAVSSGINLFDTSERYGTEELLGRALGGSRREVVISTKLGVNDGDSRRTPKDIVRALEASLFRLGTDYVDILSFHGVRAWDYAYTRDELLPVIVDYRDRGRVRAVGISEFFREDKAHDALRIAAGDNCWDVVLVGYNILNPSARESVIEPIRMFGTGVICMVPNPVNLHDARTLQRVLLDSRIWEASAGGNPSDAASYLLDLTGAHSLSDLAYRFAAQESAADSILFGTSNLHHLMANIESVLAPPLPEDIAASLRRFSRSANKLFHGAEG